MTLSALAILLLVPPVNLILIGAVGFMLGRRRLGQAMTAACLGGLLLLAVPAISAALIAALERDLRSPAHPSVTAGAIVILGADIAVSGDRPPVAAPGRLTLERLRAGAALQRLTHLPILVSGGIVRDGVEPVAVTMARSLEMDFGVPVRWVEADSVDTWQNLRLSTAMLAGTGIHAVYLVSHAWHLPRALIAARHFGLDAMPAPTQWDAGPAWRLDEFIPSASALLMSYYALHEWIGCAYYSRRG